MLKMMASLRRLMVCAVGTATLFGFTAGPASAEWRKAESERFVVYGEGREGELVTFVQKLESFDRLLRLKMGLPIDEVPLRKLPIYLVDGAGLRWVYPGVAENIAGFYAAREEDIFAVALRGVQGDHVLLHEYAHHFMYQNFAYSYPAWFVEGFAEYFATVEFEDDRIFVGKFNENRGSWLRGSGWVSMRDLLAKRSGQVRRANATYYPLAWLLTHWFLGDDTRSPMLTAYLRAVGSGVDSLEAMETATGMNREQLKQTLRRYMGRIPYYSMENPFPAVPVQVTRLSPQAEDVLLLSLRLTGVPEGRGPATLAETRRLAERYPDDVDVLVARGHAGIHLNDRDAGEAALQRALELDPDNVAALQYLADSRLERSREEGSDARALRAEARSLLGRAYRADDANYRTFLLLAEAGERGPAYPTDNDIATRELALQLAPQLAKARLMTAEIYLDASRQADAIRVIEPLANSPHGGSDAEAAQALLNRARGLSATEAAAEAAAANAVDTEPEAEPQGD